MYHLDMHKSRAYIKRAVAVRMEQHPDSVWLLLEQRQPWHTAWHSTLHSISGVPEDETQIIIQRGRERAPVCVNIL